LSANKVKLFCLCRPKMRLKVGLFQDEESTMHRALRRH